MNLKFLTVLAALSATLASLNAAEVSFDGFRHYRLSPLSAKALDRLHWLEKRFPSEPDYQAGVIFLNQPGQKFEAVDVLVPPQLHALFLSLIEATPAMRMRLVHGDYGRLLARYKADNEKTRSAGNSSNSSLRRQRRETGEGTRFRMQFQHDYYRSFSEIRRLLVELTNQCNWIRQRTCALETIGRTVEDNELLVLQISKTPSSGTSDGQPAQRSAVWLDAGIHAREWVSPATALYMADQLINVGLPASLGNYSQEAESVKEAAELVDRHEIFILTLYNPDGYEYARLRNRMWRKNREHNSLRRYCRGVDLNRNYGFEWGGVGSSGNPCADNYRGPGTFSAAETRAVRQFVSDRRNQLLMFVSLHSYGQYLLIPYGYRRKTYSLTHHEKMMCAATMAIAKMFSINDRFYAVGTGSDLMYEANGGSDDWAHGSLGIPYSYTVELPDDGDYGFLLPGRYVPGIGREIMRGLASLLGAARRLESASPGEADEVRAQCSGLMSVSINTK